MMLVCICKQAAIKKADSTVMWPSLSLSPSLSLILTHTHTEIKWADWTETIDKNAYIVY